MKIRDIKLGVQLLLGFAALLMFVIILGLVSFMQSRKLHHQTEDMYNHPLIVRRAIGMLRSDIMSIHRDMKGLFLSSNDTEIAADLQQIDISKSDAYKQIDHIYNSYLGPRSDVDSVKKALEIWNSIREETIRLLREGKTSEALVRTRISGAGSKQALAVLKCLDVVDIFAKKKGDELYAISVASNASFTKQLIYLVFVILVLTMVIYIVLLRNIRTPLKELTQVARQFHQGDLMSRSSYSSRNELGVLSGSFNALADSIQQNMKLNESAAQLTGLMLSEEDAKMFFKIMLNALCEHTGAQMAAVYIRSDNKKSFNHFESIGIEDNAKPSFSAENFEGEFGLTFSSKKIQHISEIQADTRFVFHTVSGKFTPSEIITIPILAGSEIIAIISLASVSKFSAASTMLIDKILDTMSARVEGILAFQKVRDFSKKLELQYHEMETQKTELQSQSSELIEQNVELEMQKRQLGEASRLKTSFLSNMSHELRTPLNSVIALSGVLNRRLTGKIPAEEYSYLEVIERNGKQLLSLINDILDISRIEAGREEVEVTRFNMNNLISEIVNMIHPQAQQKNVELLHLNNHINIPITSDSVKCRHILQNLIGNAVKFTEEGKVEIMASLKGNHIEIAVTDTGIGISDVHLPHVFDEFRQADGGTSRRFGGTGLGLAIAKKYANLMGGKIDVISVPGQGSTFTLTLPLSYATETQISESVDEGKTHLKYPRTKSPLEQGKAGPQKTILLVEDSEPAIIQLKDFLEESGFRILVARDGAEALVIIGQTLPDAIILDLMMPGIDGFKVLGTLRETERTSYIPVLILTAKHITRDELQFLKRNNVHQLIQKGDVNRNELLNSLAEMLDHETEAETESKTETPHRSGPVIQPIEGKPRVLVVEDNPDNMLTVRALLADKFDVLEATDGIKGVEMARNHIPDLILMDIALPGLDGISVFKAIRKDARLMHIPVIALTASAMIQDRETILAHGFDAFIAKPIDAAQFFEIINETLFG